MSSCYLDFARIDFMMNGKTPISMLQECCVSRNMAMPRYDFENRTQVSSPAVFACYCFCDDKRVEAVSSSKKGAKQRAAELMLEELKFITVPNGKSSDSLFKSYEEPVKSPPPATVLPSDGANHIGQLNEYCAGLGMPYPDYSENGYENGYFVIVCGHGSYTARGLGRTKKEAKQDAARNMMKVIRENRPNYTRKVSPALTTNNHDLEYVMDQYKKHSINPSISRCGVVSTHPILTSAEPNLVGEKSTIPQVEPKKAGKEEPDDLPLLKSRAKEADSNLSLAELAAKFEEKGVEYDVEKTQEEPVILIYSERGTKSNVSLEIGEPGEGYEIVLCRLLSKVLEQYEDIGSEKTA